MLRLEHQKRDVNAFGADADLRAVYGDRLPIRVDQSQRRFDGRRLRQRTLHLCRRNRAGDAFNIIFRTGDGDRLLRKNDILLKIILRNLIIALEHIADRNLLVNQAVEANFHHLGRDRNNLKILAAAVRRNQIKLIGTRSRDAGKGGRHGDILRADAADDVSRAADHDVYGRLSAVDRVETHLADESRLCIDVDADALYGHISGRADERGDKKPAQQRHHKRDHR